MRYVAIIDEEFTRDMQLLSDVNADPDDDDNWEDWGGSGSAQVFLGIYSGSERTAKELAAQENGVSPEHVSLVPVPDDEGFVPCGLPEIPREITVDAAETLKKAVMLSGRDAVEVVLGYAIPDDEDKDVTDNRLDQAVMAMSPAEFRSAWMDYVLPPEGGAGNAQ